VALEEFRHAQGLGGAERYLPRAKVGTAAFAALKLIGQFQLTYLVCEENGSLILIDQHAAHERIGFEQLKRSYSQGKIVQQNLLQPYSFDLSPPDAERLRLCLEDLENFGLAVEEFGEHSFVLKAHPTLLSQCDWLALLKALAEQIGSEDKVQALQHRVDQVLATMACHRQIRANHRLTPEEMDALLKDLEGTPRSYHCPHGRPVMVEIEAREIEKWFKRVL
jgi:DNA mismatch repair protein MutL